MNERYSFKYENNKASGLDGLQPVEFYQCFRDQLSRDQLSISLCLICWKKCNVDLSTLSGYMSYPQTIWKIYIKRLQTYQLEKHGL